MSLIKVSVFASAIRPYLWKEFLDSLKNTKLEFEVVFGGPCTIEEIKPFINEYPFLKYIHTANIKPAQVYECCRRNCTGELLNWTADDCVYSDHLLDKVYEFWKSLRTGYTLDYLTNRNIISVKTNENESNNDLNDQRLLGGNLNTPLMAPLGFIGKWWLDKLGGFDRRFISGQYENQCVMMSNQNGGKVFKFEDGCVSIAHIKKHGNSTNFWKSYEHDRMILENSWVIGGYASKPTIALDIEKKIAFYPIANREVSLVQLDKFEPYEDTNLLTKSQSFKGDWE